MAKVNPFDLLAYRLKNGLSIDEAALIQHGIELGYTRPKRLVTLVRKSLASKGITDFSQVTLEKIIEFGGNYKHFKLDPFTKVKTKAKSKTPEIMVNDVEDAAAKIMQTLGYLDTTAVNLAQDIATLYTKMGENYNLLHAILGKAVNVNSNLTAALENVENAKVAYSLEQENLKYSLESVLSEELKIAEVELKQITFNSPSATYRVLAALRAENNIGRHDVYLSRIIGRTHLSEKTVNNAINKLMREGIVSLNMKGKQQVYYLVDGASSNELIAKIKNMSCEKDSSKITPEYISDIQTTTKLDAPENIVCEKLYRISKSRVTLPKLYDLCKLRNIAPDRVDSILESIAYKSGKALNLSFD
jgi:predicted transcriptional regulator